MSPRRALITGITGQDGSYLAELLLDKGYEVHGMVRRSSTETFQRLERIRDEITLHTGDLLDQRSLVDVLRDCEPDEIYNLAAMSFVAASWIAAGADRRVHRRRRDAHARGDARGRPRGALLPGVVLRDVRQVPRGPADRDDAVLPALARTAWPRPTATSSRSTTASRYDLFACSGILFNHESERRGLEFVTRKVTHGAAAIKLGLQEELALGNLDAERDWGYAKDYVEAMWLMLQQDEPDDYVIATGEAHCVRELSTSLSTHVGLDPADHVRIDPRFLRPAEVEHLIGDSSKARDKLGLGAAHQLRGDGQADGRLRPRAAGQRRAPEASGLRCRWPPGSATSPSSAAASSGWRWRAS